MSRLADLTDLDALDFEKSGGLLPVIAQHAHTGEVLMLAYGDREALASTLRDGELWLRSRSRGAPWRKGETSGNVLRVVSLHADCDADAVLARVVPAGPACHTGATSCFAAPPTLAALGAIIAARAAASAVRDVVPATGSSAAPAATPPPSAVPASYTRRLLDDDNLRLKKLGEEAVELALACAAGEPEAVAAEGADLLYHLLIACAGAGVPLATVLARLEDRRGSGGRVP